MEFPREPPETIVRRANLKEHILSARHGTFLLMRLWPHIKGYLMDICLTAQDTFKVVLDKFRITYQD